MNILSIDWDYFIDGTADEKQMVFPDGGREYPKKLMNIIWTNIYSNLYGKKLIDFDIRKDEFSYILDIINNLPTDIPVGIAESHSSILEFLVSLKAKSKFNIYNIDFHHDLFQDTNYEFNCGNWLYHLIKKNKIDKATWIRNNDSQLPKNDFGINITTDYKQLKTVKFDAVFICKSNPWTPPHLDVMFYVMAYSMYFLRSKYGIIYDKEVLNNRYLEIEPQANELKKMLLEINNGGGVKNV